MFHVTFLGHQGWLVESASTRVLVDPLLGAGLGNMPDDGLDVYPPRRIDLQAFPPIDAVIATHEHADHLSLPSLLRLDRSIPVLLPARTSAAAVGIVRELGFPVQLLETGDATVVGDLEVSPFASNEITRDEWDVRPLLIRDRGGDGSLATSIDAPESTAFARFALERAGSIGVWASSHNHMDIFPVREGGGQERESEVTAGLVSVFGKRFTQHFGSGVRPRVLAVLASGFSFRGDLAWMNGHVFPGASEKIAAAVRPELHGVEVRAPLPGHRLSFSRGELRDETPSSPFLASLEPGSWPPHAAEPFEGALPDFAPACGRRDFSREDLAMLLDALRGFAAHLYGREVFRALYACADDAFAPRRAAIGFAVRTPSEMLTLVYRPDACAFAHVPGADAENFLVAGLRCWASDLLAIMRIELLVGYMLIGRYRKWNTAPDRVQADLDGELALYGHPLRHPDGVLELYRRTAGALAHSIGSERLAGPSRRAAQRHQNRVIDGSA
jgi:hypothetical protein